MDKRAAMRKKKLARRLKRTNGRFRDHGEVFFELKGHGVEIRDCIERKGVDCANDADACSTCNDLEVCKALRKILLVSERIEDPRVPKDVSRDRDL